MDETEEIYPLGASEAALGASGASGRGVGGWSEQGRRAARRGWRAVTVGVEGGGGKSRPGRARGGLWSMAWLEQVLAWADRWPEAHSVRRSSFT